MRDEAAISMVESHRETWCELLTISECRGCGDSSQVAVVAVELQGTGIGSEFLSLPARDGRELFVRDSSRTPLGPSGYSCGELDELVCAAACDGQPKGWEAW